MAWASGWTHPQKPASSVDESGFTRPGLSTKTGPQRGWLGLHEVRIHKNRPLAWMTLAPGGAAHKKARSRSHRGAAARTRLAAGGQGPHGNTASTQHNRMAPSTADYAVPRGYQIVELTKKPGKAFLRAGLATSRSGTRTKGLSEMPLWGTVSLGQSMVSAPIKRMSMSIVLEW